MSTRLYPLYQKGNPQLRVFLPNFWMKLSQLPNGDLRPNHVNFICSMEMSGKDVQEYLEKIYKIPVVTARTRIMQGKFSRVRGKGYVVKDDDYKIAFVTLPKGMKFEFPDIFPKDKVDKDIENEKKNMNNLRNNYKEYIKRNQLRPDVPGWFL